MNPTIRQANQVKKKNHFTFALSTIHFTAKHCFNNGIIPPYTPQHSLFKCYPIYPILFLILFHCTFYSIPLVLFLSLRCVISFFLLANLISRGYLRFSSSVHSKAVLVRCSHAGVYQVHSSPCLNDHNVSWDQFRGITTAEVKPRKKLAFISDFKSPNHFGPTPLRLSISFTKHK